MGHGGPIAVEVRHRFAATLREGFDYITDLGNWPEYWPGLVHIDPASEWREPGDRARLALRMLGREVELLMTLTRLDPCRMVEYVSEQRGLPSARHQRHFQATEGGFAYRIRVEYDPRPGFRGSFDRIVVRRAIDRTATETMANLGRRLGAA